VGNKKKQSQPNKQALPVVQPPHLAAAAAAAAPFFLAATQIQQHQHVPDYAGPIPPPAMLKEYDSILPGLADRIMRMAEQEAEHRRNVEAQLLAAQIADAQKYRRVEIIGQLCGLLIGFAAIGAAVYAGVHGAQWTGSLIGTTGVTGLVTAFILGRTLLMKQKRQDAELARQNAETAASLQREHDAAQSRLDSKPSQAST
jgi:uncharacterized membrane protein